MDIENKEMSGQAESSGIGHFPEDEDLVITSVEMLKSPNTGIKSRSVRTL
ncbi:Uncharacterised protein [Actinobacillus pleuropneumoniae]|nr:Uncharacterised protein [Actinobacillus pleuropneumoniae]